MKYLVLTALALLLGCALAFKPVRVGDLLLSVDNPGEGDAVSGLVFLLNHTAVYIRDFQYSIQGEDAEFCAGASTAGTDDAYTLDFRVNEGDADPSPIPGTGSFTAADLELSLPEGKTVAEVAWFGLCRASDTSSVLASVVILPQVVSNVPCNTTFIGELPNGTNGTAGRVYQLDRLTIAVIGFSYNGQAPDGFFWVGAGDTPSLQGFPCAYGDNIVTSLPAFSDQDVVVHVPGDAEGTEISHFALYCRSNNVALENIPVEEGLFPVLPTPATPSDGFIGNLRTRAHRVSGAVYALDERTIMIENFNYDGTAPGAVFYANRGGGVGIAPTYIIPDETGSTRPLDAYRNRNIVLTLPSSITLHTIDWFSVWCDPFNINFGEVAIPDNIEFASDPGDLVMATLPPREECTELESAVEVNCKMFGDASDVNISVSWAIDSTNDIIVIQICGCVLPDHYIAFGISGSDSRVQMVGGDVTWTWLDDEGVHAEDLDLTAREQCVFSQNGGDVSQSGACPDTTNNVFSVSGFRDGCTTCIKFARPLNSSDPRDKPFLLGQEQYVIWSSGPVGSLATPDGDTIPVPFRHFTRADPTSDLRVDFGRSPVDECNLECSMCEVVLEPWARPILEHTTTINARIGQSGSERGYQGITGIPGWGIAWYLNGLLIPSVTVYRGTTYTFVVEGGEDPAIVVQYHPFYITDSDRGGYLFKSPQDQQEENIYAGFNGTAPIGVGRYCEYQNKDSDRSNEFDTFDDYKSTLELVCQEGSPGSFTWTPDEYTPDVLYYQCATHQFLGWSIRVMDALPEPTPSTTLPSASIPLPSTSVPSPSPTLTPSPSTTPNGRPPSPPRVDPNNLPSLTDTTASVCWLPSEDTGGRSDFHYNVYVSSSRRNNFVKSNTAPITDVCYTVTGLDLSTSYLIVVVAANGATGDPDTFSDVSVVQDRFVRFLVTTEDEGTPCPELDCDECPTPIVADRPGAISVVTSCGELVVWEPPEGEVDYYIVRIYYRNSRGRRAGTQTRNISKDRPWVQLSWEFERLVQGLNYYVQVRARNSAGSAPWSVELRLLNFF